jgi:hypothetical protein
MDNEEYIQMSYEEWVIYVKKTGDQRFNTCCENCGTITIIPNAITTVPINVCFNKCVRTQNHL